MPAGRCSYAAKVRSRATAPKAETCRASDSLEISIGTQQLGVEIDASLSDDAVDRSAHRDAFVAKEAQQAGGANVASHRRLNDRQRLETLPGPPEASLRPKSPEELP